MIYTYLLVFANTYRITNLQKKINGVIDFFFSITSLIEANIIYSFPVNAIRTPLL